MASAFEMQCSLFLVIFPKEAQGAPHEWRRADALHVDIRLHSSHSACAEYSQEIYHIRPH